MVLGEHVGLILGTCTMPGFLCLCCICFVFDEQVKYLSISTGHCVQYVLHIVWVVGELVSTLNTIALSTTTVYF